MEFDLGCDMQVLSWAMNRPGFVRARRIVWREVRNADLTLDLDVGAWLSGELCSRDARDAVTLLTSRDISCYTEHKAQVAQTSAHAVATVGFSNAERVGHRLDRSGQDWGTINVALRLNQPVTQPALLEVMSIVVEARTAAVMDAGLVLPTGLATGTGTDCVAVAAPEGDTPYAGLHTEIGEATGRAVYNAVSKGARDWMQSYRPQDQDTPHEGIKPQD
jgi:adenosylcobinamide amidohydrolase